METDKYIVLIDDEASLVRALKLMLEAAGLRIKEFSDPGLAVSYLEETKGSEAELILCDLRMPQLDGFDVLELASKFCPLVPFILISAHATSEDTDRARKLGAAGHLLKPFTPDQVKALLAEQRIRADHISS